MKRQTPNGRLIASAVAAALLSAPALFTVTAAPAVQADRTTQALDEADVAPPPVVDTPIPEDPEVDAMNPAPPPSDPMPRASLQAEGDAWAALDTDGDGRVSQAEARADSRFSARFGAMDSDGDGQVDRAEYDASLSSDAGLETEPEEEDEGA